MCCGSAFWKGFFVFVLTFAGGVFVSGLFASNRACTARTELPAIIQKPQHHALSDKKNCVPVDGNLKYERLTADEKPDFEAIKKDEKKRSLKAEGKTQKNSAASKQQFYSPSEDKPEVKDLLHREKCFDVQDQK